MIYRNNDMEIRLEHCITDRIKVGLFFKRDKILIVGTAIAKSECEKEFRFDFKYIGNPEESENYFLNFLREKAGTIYEDKRIEYYDSLTLNNYISKYEIK